MKRQIAFILALLVAASANAESFEIQRNGSDVLVPITNITTAGLLDAATAETFTLTCGCAAIGASVTMGACDGSTACARDAATANYNCTVKAADLTNEYCKIIADTGTATNADHVIELVSAKKLNFMDLTPLANSAKSGLVVAGASSTTAAGSVAASFTGGASTWANAGGNGGSAIVATAGAKHANGTGGGTGLNLVGSGNAAGLLSQGGATGDGAQFNSAGLAYTAYSAGLVSRGGAGSHRGMYIAGNTDGPGILANGGATSAPGLSLVGTGSGAGLLATGGATGPGGRFLGGATEGNGLETLADGQTTTITGTGLLGIGTQTAATNNAISGAGALFQGGAGDGPGMSLLGDATATGSGNGASLKLANVGYAPLHAYATNSTAAYIGAGGGNAAGLTLQGNGTAGAVQITPGSTATVAISCTGNNCTSQVNSTTLVRE